MAAPGETRAAEGPAAASAGIAPAVAEVARRGEPDRYLAALLGPAAAAPALVAIAAFAASIHRIPATVRDPMIGEIRLQWWRDALAVAAGATGNPVADAMQAATRSRGLDPSRLEAALEAASFDLAGDLHPDAAALTAHLAASEGTVFAASLAVLAPADAQRPGSDRLAGAAGIAYGLSRALLRLPETLHNGGFPIPEDRLVAHGLSRARLAEAEWAPATIAGLEAARRELAGTARAALAEVRAGLAMLSRAGRHAFLPLAMVEPYLRLQTQGGLAQTAPAPDATPLGRIARLGLARLTGRL